jgi:Dolichyl-phosphate-mannose-protein mannosyltransferase
MDPANSIELIVSLALVGVAAVHLRLLPMGAAPAHATRLRRALLAALLTRWLAGVLIYYLAPYGAFAEDNWSYAHYGQKLSDYWQGHGSVPSMFRGQMDLKLSYYYLNAVLFTLLGFAPLALVTLNCFVGTLTTWLAYRVAAELVDREAALRAAWLAALFPSLVLWSSMNLRDVWVLCSFLWLAFAVLIMRHRRWVTALVAGGAGLGGIFLFRPYLLPLVTTGLLAGSILSSMRKVKTAVLLAALLPAGLLILSIYSPREPLKGTTVDGTLREISLTRHNLGSGGSSYMQDVKFHSVWDVIAFLPTGTIYFLLGPFPWAARGFRQFITVPEMLIWYGLIPRVLQGVRVAFRRSPSETIALLSMVVCFALPYVLVSSNLGTAYRHRAQVLVFLLIFAAAGLLDPRRRSRWTDPRPTAEAPVAPTTEARLKCRQAGVGTHPGRPDLSRADLPVTRRSQ